MPCSAVFSLVYLFEVCLQLVHAYLSVVVFVAMPTKVRGRGRGAEAGRSRTAAPGRGDAQLSAAEVESSQTGSISQEELMTTMKEIQEELRALRQVVPNTPAAARTVAREMPEGGATSGVSLREWVSMKLDSFDGSGTPIQAADWLAYIEMQLDAFDVLPRDKIRYVTQLMKGEAQIWWRGVQSARTVAHGDLTWSEFVRQFERRFYPATFLDKM